MAKKENKFKGYDISTQAVHTGVAYDAETGAVRRPLHMANSYKLPDDLSKVNYSSTDLLMYARNGNPNQHWLEEKVAALHGADDAIVLGSGVAALHALFWTLLKTGDRVVYPKVSYMAVYRLFHELFNRKFGVETVMVDMTDLEKPSKKRLRQGRAWSISKRRTIQLTVFRTLRPLPKSLMKMERSYLSTIPLHRLSISIPWISALTSSSNR